MSTNSGLTPFWTKKSQIIKWFLYGLSLLAINYLVLYGAVLVLMLSFFRSDLILAAVPAVLILPAILSQPWSLLFLFIPGRLAPLLTTVITVFIYGWLEADGRLERPKQFLRLKRRRILVVVGGIILMLLTVSIARYMDFPSLHSGAPPYIRADGLALTDSRYYCLGKFIDSQWLWQARLNESDLTSFGKTHRLHEIDSSSVPPAFRSMPPYWWHPRIAERTRFFSTPDFPVHVRGEDGLYLMAAWNPEDEILHVWIKYNF